MATIFKRPTSCFYFACYRDRKGRQVRRTTKLTDKAAALRVALEMEAVEKMAKEGAAAVSNFQKMVNDVSVAVVGSGIPSPSVETYLEEWIDAASRRCAKKTMERYRYQAREFLAFLGPVGKQPIRAVLPVHIEGYLNRLVDTGVAPATAILAVKTLAIAFGRATKYGYIDRNPVLVVPLPKATASERETFTLAEVEKLVAAADDLDWQTAILLGAYTGARLSDCVSMTWDHIDADSGFLRFVQRKTDRKVLVPLHPRLVKHLHHLSEFSASGPLTPKLMTTPTGGNNGLSRGFTRIVERAGLDLMVVPGKGKSMFTKRSFHSLRHGFISALANSGVSEEVRMKLTGHASSGIHQRYTHLNPEPLKEAIRRIG